MCVCLLTHTCMNTLFIYCVCVCARLTSSSSHLGARARARARAERRRGGGGGEAGVEDGWSESGVGMDGVKWALVA